MTTRYDAPPRIALLIETARGFGRNLLCGISRYAQHNGPWRFHVSAGDWEQAAPKIKQWGVDGIIGRIPNERVAKAVLDAGVPAVAIGLSDDQLKSSHPLSKLPEVSPIEERVVRLAVEHLQDRYLKHFAFVGLDDRSWSKRREVLFQRQVARLGASVHVYKTPHSARDRIWDREQFIMADWLRGLPKPLGLFACNDDRGREVLEACHLADATVPEDVAVLGVDDDEVFCGLAYPPLSSVVLNADAAGYRAAELLAEQMNGGARRRQHIIVEAPRVVARRSTDVLAIADRDVAAALEFIHGVRGIDVSVDRVAEKVAVSRRMLEKRFRTAIGRSILEEIQLTRLARAKQLLIETIHPISRIAVLSGFNSISYFTHFFQKRVGKTPRQFRIEMS